MARWQPDARGRLLQAALELFAEHGYDATTAAQIAERAGLTKTTLFRHFTDKREILFQGQPALVSIVTTAVGSAPDDATPLELLHSGIGALSDSHIQEQKAIGRQIAKLLLASPELRERAAYKRSVLTAALEAALIERVENRHLASTLADLGIRSYYDGFDLWSEAPKGQTLAQIVFGELEALLSALSVVAVSANEA